MDPVELKAKMTDPIKFQGKFHDGALKDVPLDNLKRKDIEIWMARLEDTPAAANHALAALSVAAATFAVSKINGTPRQPIGLDKTLIACSPFFINPDDSFKILLYSSDMICSSLDFAMLMV